MYDPHYWIAPLVGRDPHSPMARALRATSTIAVRPFAGLGDQVALCRDCGEVRFEAWDRHSRRCPVHAQRRKGWRLPR